MCVELFRRGRIQFDMWRLILLYVVSLGWIFIVTQDRMSHHPGFVVQSSVLTV